MPKRTRAADRVKRLAGRLRRGGMPHNSRGAGVRFEGGHKKRGGRKKGARNRLTREVAEAIIAAAEEIGSNGRGKGGVQGYMKFLGRREPRIFGMLLRAVMPLQINANVRQSQVYKTPEEIRAAMHARGIPYERFYPLQYDHDDLPERAGGPIIDLESEEVE